MPLLWVNDTDWKNLLAAVARIDRATKGLVQTTNKMETTLSALDDAFNNVLIPQATANTNAENAAIVLIKQLADLTAANSTQPQAILDLAAKMKTTADALGAAIVAGTPVQTTPPPAA